MPVRPFHRRRANTMSPNAEKSIMTQRLRYADFVEFIRKFERNEIPARELYHALLWTHRIYGEGYVVRRAREISAYPQRYGIRANSVMVRRYFAFFLARAFQSTLKPTYAEFVVHATSGSLSKYQDDERLLSQLADAPEKFVRRILDRSPKV